MATRTMETTVVIQHGHVTPCHLAMELLVPITIIKQGLSVCTDSKDTGALI